MQDAEEQAADRAWSLIAGELQRERRRRKKRTRVTAGISSAAVLTAAIFLSWPPRHETQTPAMATAQPAIVEEALPPEIPRDSTLAVMVWHDGAGRLQELSPADFGELDFEFNLEPVMAWSDPME